MFKYSCLHFPPPPLSPTPTIPISTTFFKSFYLFIFRERGREGEKEGEKLRCVVVSRMPPSGDLSRNSGMCPDWELNQQPFGLQARTQCTELHQPGLCFFFKINFIRRHWLVGSYSFQVCTSMVHDWCDALRAHHPNSSHLALPYIRPPYPFTTPTPFPLVTTTLLSASMGFSFTTHIWAKSYGS